MRTSRTAAVFRTLGVASLALLLSGCSEELGPVPFRTTGVKGVVRERARPVSRGWIEFMPVNGTVGNLRSARLHPDGSFEATGVAIGENLIRFENAAIATPGAVRHFGSYNSPIRRVITDQPSASLDIDLVEELIRFEGSRGREARSQALK